MPISLPSIAARVFESILPEAPLRGAEVVARDGRSLPLVSAALRAEAQGGIARLVLEQRFENPHDETLHVTYRMPLPADGAVSGYAFEIAGRTITGRIDRKRAAREQFEHAVASGKTAALLEQERADIFTQSIGNLPAHEALVVRISIDQKLLWLPEGEWELRFPTVIGPRYVGASEPVEITRATAVATAVGGVPARIRIAVAIGDALIDGRVPSSPSHALQIAGDGVVELRDVAGARLDRDIVVRWPVARAQVGLSLATARSADRPEMFGLVTIVPPAREVNPAAFARDLIVLVDTSGSMSGRPLDTAKRVVAMLIESLGAGDRIELIEFSTRPRSYKPDAAAATPEEKQAALRWLRALNAGGSTEMHAAVLEAMRALRPGAQRQVVLVTDGYIGGEDQVVRELQYRLPRSCRLHVLGVGSSVNRSLATAMARAGRGAEVLCDLDEDAERAARRIIDRTRMPILTDVTIWGSALVAQAPELLPDVYEGAPFVAAVQLRPGELVVRGELARERWEQHITVADCSAGAGNPAIAALFGRERVADLEAQAVAGVQADAQIESAGLAFQIATRLTSWVAIDQSRAVTGPSRHEVMPQALPYGTTAAAFGVRSPAYLGREGSVMRMERIPFDFDTMGEASALDAWQPGTDLDEIEQSIPEAFEEVTGQQPMYADPMDAGEALLRAAPLTVQPLDEPEPFDGPTPVVAPPQDEIRSRAARLAARNLHAPVPLDLLRSEPEAPPLRSEPEAPPPTTTLSAASEAAGPVVPAQTRGAWFRWGRYVFLAFMIALVIALVIAALWLLVH